MDGTLIAFFGIIFALIVLDLLALRFGVDSRSAATGRRDWW
jgi:hypothetical protein